MFFFLVQTLSYLNIEIVLNIVKCKVYVFDVLRQISIKSMILSCQKHITAIICFH